MIRLIAFFSFLISINQQLSHARRQIIRTKMWHNLTVIIHKSWCIQAGLEFKHWLLFFDLSLSFSSAPLGSDRDSRCPKLWVRCSTKCYFVSTQFGLIYLMVR
jgi:hypothetical protein